MAIMEDTSDTVVESVIEDAGWSMAEDEPGEHHGICGDCLED